MNPGGSFDAYWELSGTFDAENNSTQTTTQSTAHLDATLSGHVVLFGNDVNVASVSAVIDASSGQGTFSTCEGGPKTSPDTFACFDVYLFGNHIFSHPVEGSVTIPNGPLFSQSTEFDLPPIPIWIFSITLGATASVELDLNNAQFAISGFDLELTPSATLGAHMFGGISLGIASGGVDAKVDLLVVSAPLAAEAIWSVSTLPTTCSATLNLMFSGQVDISSGGGEVDLVASLGPCPFCVDESWTLFSWPALVSVSYPLFNSPLKVTTLPLPTGLCGRPLTVSFTSPTSTAPLNDEVALLATVTSPDEGQIICGGNGSYTTQYTWSVNPPDILNPASGQGCNVSATFNALGQRSLSLAVTATFTDQFGRKISESSPLTSETITVTQLPAGPHINSISTVPAGQASIVVDSPGAPPPYDGDTLSSCGIGGGNIVTTASCPVAITFGSTLYPIQLGGLVSGLSGTLCTNWTATPLGGTPVQIGPTLSGTTPTAIWNASTGTYTITMTTSDCNGHVQGTPATMQVLIGFNH